MLKTPYFAIFASEEDFKENTASFQKVFVKIFDSIKDKKSNGY